jgi:hypothetical protein
MHRSSQLSAPGHLYATRACHAASCTAASGTGAQPVRATTEWAMPIT